MSKSKPTFDEIEDLSQEFTTITLCKKPRISYTFPSDIVKDLKKICQGRTLRFVGVRKMNLTSERREELRERMKVLGVKNRKTTLTVPVPVVNEKMSPLIRLRMLATKSRMGAQRI